MSKRKAEENEDIEESKCFDDFGNTEETKCFKNLSENEVFVTEYINKTSSFSGIIKQRFSDFQVNEIDLRGELAELSNITVDLNLSISKVSSNNDNHSEQNDEYDSDDIDVNVKPVEELTYPVNSDDQWKQMLLLLKRNKKEESIKVEITNVSKEDRRHLHHEIDSKFKKKLLTNTLIDKEGKRFMIIGTNKNSDKRNFHNWPKDVPDYLYAVLFKENTDTITAVEKISKKLRINRKTIAYAGTKDRRGITSQWISLRHVGAEKLASLSYKDKLCFGNFEYRKEPLRLGDLRGNRFRLALRNVDSSADKIEKTMQHFKNHGFINYFGLQRFGSYSAAPTHEIGRCLISKKWKEAIDLILKIRPKDDHVNEACKIWNETANPTEALKPLNRYRDHSIEGSVLRTLSAQGSTAYVNALQKLPRNVTLLYLHSFQSLVWNRIVSERIKKFGFNPLPGDLIYVDEKKYEKSRGDNSDEPVRAVSEDEIDDIKIQNVVYPLPGYAVKYPKNVIGQWYEEILKEYNVEFNKTDTNKAFTLSGDYRKIIVIPEEVEWRSVYYKNISADLILSDYQKLTKTGNVENFNEGNYKAVILQFSLPSSTYATMALREITKVDTSSSYQASLTLSHLQTKVPKVEDS